MKFEEMKTTIKSLLERYYDVTEDDAEDMILNIEGDIDDEIFLQILEENGAETFDDGVSISGLNVCEKMFEMDINRLYRREYLARLTFGQCVDVYAANDAMEEYDKSEWSKTLSFGSEVEDYGDPLVLEFKFHVYCVEDLRDSLVWMFMTLQDKKFKCSLMKILKYFEN